MDGQSSQNTASTANQPPLMTVAICTRNRAAFLRAALESVLKQVDDDTEIMVIDNASSDDTPKVAREFAGRHSCVTVVREEELGLSAARNAALRQARGDNVIFLDDDATVEPGWLAAFREPLTHPPLPELAAVGGAVFPRYSSPPPRWLPPNVNTLNWSDQAQQFPDGRLPWGGNLAVRRDRALAVGGFDTALGRKGNGLGADEDSDLLLRLKQKGGQLWWAPGARILHYLARERFTFGGSFQAAFGQGRSSAIYRFRARANRHQPRRLLYRLGRLVLTPFHCLACLLAAAFILLTGRLDGASKQIFRCARVAGFGLQIGLDLFKKPEPDHGACVRCGR